MGRPTHAEPAASITIQARNSPSPASILPAAPMPPITFRPFRRSRPSVMLFCCARRATADRVATRHPSPGTVHSRAPALLRAPAPPPTIVATQRSHCCRALPSSPVRRCHQQLCPRLLAFLSPASPLVVVRPSDCCCPLAPAPRSASGLAINICDVLVEEGGPRVEAKRRGGDPLPRASCRAKFPERAGSCLVPWVVRL